MPQQPQSRTPAVGEDVTALMPKVGDDVSALMGLKPPPVEQNRQSVVFPQAGPDIPKIFGDIILGALKSVPNAAISAARMNPMNVLPAFAQPVPEANVGYVPTDIEEALKPRGMAQTAGSFLPDLAVGAALGRSASRANEIAPVIKDYAMRSWNRASGRPLAEISGNPRLARDVLEARIGPMTQENAVKQAELRASKLPGRIDTRTPAVPEVEPVTLYDEGGNAMQVGGVEGKRGTGFVAQPTKPRQQAFNTTQASYDQAKNRRPIKILGTEIPNPVPKGTTAQFLFDNAAKIQSALPGTAIGFADILSRLFARGGDQR